MGSCGGEGQGRLVDLLPHLKREGHPGVQRDILGALGCRLRGAVFVEQEREVGRRNDLRRLGVLEKFKLELLGAVCTR